MSVLVSRLQHRDVGAVGDVDEPIRLVDAARPRAGQCVFQRLRGRSRDDLR